MLLPGERASLSIVAGQQFQIQHIDDPIIIQIRRRGRGSVVAHPNRQRIELIDDIVAVDVTSRQADRGHRARVPARQRCGPLSIEKTTRRSNHGIGSSRSRQAEGTIRIGSHRGDQRVRRIVQTHCDWLAGQDLAGERPIGG